MQSKIIFLVEDNKDDELLTLRALKKNSIANEIVVARDGDEALRVLFDVENNNRDIIPHIQLVMLDLNLPKVSGLDVLRAIRANEKTKRIPVVILTSSLEQQDIIQSYDLGANSYVRKPVNFDQFIEATRQLGMYWLLLNQTANY